MSFVPSLSSSSSSTSSAVSSATASSLFPSSGNGSLSPDVVLALAKIKTASEQMKALKTSAPSPPSLTSSWEPPFPSGGGFPSLSNAMGFPSSSPSSSSSPSGPSESNNSSIPLPSGGRKRSGSIAALVGGGPKVTRKFTIDELFDAIARGDVDSVQEVANSGQVSLITVGSEGLWTGLTPLNFAISTEREEISLVLLLAASRQSVSIANAPDAQGYGPLHCAVSLRSEIASTFVRLVLSMDSVDVNMKNVSGNTPFHNFCEKYRSDDYVTILNLFFEKKVNVNAQTASGETPLHKALLNKSTTVRETVVQALMKHGASPSLCKYSGESPLHFAVFLGLTEMIVPLLRWGTSANLASKTGDTPYAIAKAQKMSAVIKLFDEWNDGMHRAFSPFADHPLDRFREGFWWDVAQYCGPTRLSLICSKLAIIVRKRVQSVRFKPHCSAQIIRMLLLSPTWIQKRWNHFGVCSIEISNGCGYDFDLVDPLTSISFFPSLKKLSLCGASNGLLNSLAQHVVDLTHLEKLEAFRPSPMFIGRPVITPFDPTELLVKMGTHMKNLQTLRLTLPSIAFPKHSGQSVSLLSLQKLDLRFSDIDDSFVMALFGSSESALCLSLTDLCLMGCERLTSVAYSHVFFCRRLTSLNVCSTSFDDSSLRGVMKNATRLSHIDLGYCHKITEYGLVRALKRINSPITVVLRGCEGLKDKSNVLEGKEQLKTIWM